MSNDVYLGKMKVRMSLAYVACVHLLLTVPAATPTAQGLELTSTKETSNDIEWLPSKAELVTDATVIVTDEAGAGAPKHQMQQPYVEARGKSMLRTISGLRHDDKYDGGVTGVSATSVGLVSNLTDASVNSSKFICVSFVMRFHAFEFVLFQIEALFQ